MKREELIFLIALLCKQMKAKLVCCELRFCLQDKLRVLKQYRYFIKILLESFMAIAGNN